jgi:uncharacterized metal-binding protein
MSENCCTTNGNIMILACSGGSNVGQLSNQAAVELTQEGFGKMFCLAGIGGHLNGFVQSAKDVPQMVAIDGCALGIEKNKDFSLRRADIDKVKGAVKDACSRQQASQFGTTKGDATSCCG